MADALRASDLVVATGVPGFLSLRGATYLRITSSGWAEVSVDGRRSECRLGVAALADLADALGRLPVQGEVEVVDDVPRRTLEFSVGGTRRRVVLLGPPFDDGYSGVAAAEVLWTRIHDLVTGGA